MFCASCGNQLVAGAMFCGSCGTPVASAQPAAAGLYGQPTLVTSTPPKSFLTAWLLSFFLGWLGIDRFYLGHVALGIAKLIASFIGSLLIVGWVIWPLIDMILMLSGRLKDAQGRALEGFDHYKRTAFWVTLGVWGGGFILGSLALVFLIAAIAGLSGLYY